MKKPIFLALSACLVAPLALAAPVARAQNSLSPTQSFGARARLAKIKRSGKGWSAAATYPVFGADTPVARYANWRLRTDAQSQLRAGVAQLSEDFERGITPDIAYEYGLTPMLAFYGANLISIEQIEFFDMGGAHPSTVIGTRNYGGSGGQPKRLTLGDFFVNGSNYRTTTLKKVLARLAENGAPSVVDGTVKTLNTDQLNSFVAEADGLKWIFSPYEMGPYSAGAIEAKLKISELGPDFRRELLKQ